MKKEIKLPTIIGLVFLTLGLVAGLFLINSSQIFRLGAQTEAVPQDIRVSNITTSSLTVTWVTDVDSQGFIKWGVNDSTLNKVSLEQGEEKNIVHSATIYDLQNNEDVYFIINSEKTDFDNEGIPWKSKTLNNPASSDKQLGISGTIFMEDGSSPKGAIVYVNVEGNLFSTLASANGSWFIPLSSYTDFNLDTTLLEINIYAGNLGSAKALIYPLAAKNTPTMVIGKTYDFRSLEPTENGQLPESSLTIPEQMQQSSRFEVTESEASETQTVTLESIDEEEIINTLDPEFFGSAPKNMEIEIIVESETQTETITSNNSGNWSWSPPQSLEEGKHTVTIKWRDANGILRTLTRTFYVQAAEGPAFEATPSATTTATATATATSVSRETHTPTTTPTITATTRTTATPTSTSTSVALLATQTPTAITTAEPEVYEAGTLTPTIGLFIMGIGVLFTSVFIWKQTNA